MAFTSAAWKTFVLQITGADHIARWVDVQRLWSGYGQIIRCHLVGADRQTVIVKHVKWPSTQSHPRGWTTDRSHARKAKSYQVESVWYRDFAPRCTAGCRVPQCLGLNHEGDEVVMVMEDLDASGFNGRQNRLTEADLAACLRWLAEFHGTFMHVAPTGLWQTGTYWHLATRPDELAVLRKRLPALAEAASEIDQRLNASPFKTLVHGDAKVANFCFSTVQTAVAAVDFQYVGGGCGMKDLAYLMSSCLDEAECQAREDEMLSLYFMHLRTVLARQVSSIDADALEADWRALYPFAWADFYRFLEGWSPGHWKSHGYTRRITEQVLANL
ncbi:MAG: phosphotransferase [Myxococcota bacterium]|nr:phosphotransferase [Myxococcota bacterium]